MDGRRKTYARFGKLEPDRSLKVSSWPKYVRIVRAMFQLRDEQKFYVRKSHLAEKANMSDEDKVDKLAMELRVNGIFDPNSREVCAYTLTQDQYKAGHFAAQLKLIKALTRRSRPWMVIEALGRSCIGKILKWLGLNTLWDITKYVVGLIIITGLTHMIMNWRPH